MTGPGVPVPIVAIVDLHDRHELAGRAGEERLVGAEQIVVPAATASRTGMPTSAPTSNRNSRVMPGKQARVERRRQRRAVLDDEEVRRVHSASSPR